MAPHEAEQKILKALWQQGAHICLHSDPQLVENNAHWSCADHKQWMKAWHSTCESFAGLAQYPKSAPQKHFLSGYDVHSQLLEVKELLHKQDDTSSTAIVLTSSGLLMPMLHHLPDTNFNVSMGYPLNKSPLFALLDAVMKLHTTVLEREGSKQYYWRSLLHCIRHPYIQMLKTLPPQDDAGLSQAQYDGAQYALLNQDVGQDIGQSMGQDTGQAIRHILHHMENTLRQGSRYVDVQALANVCTTACTAQGHELINDIIEALTNNFSGLSTPKDLAQALMELCQILLNYGSGIWENSPLDAEALYRLMQRVIPTLMGSSLAHEALPLPTLFTLMQHLMQAERVPFEAAPITGLQVLGLFETRLLHFERVIVVDATDDILPGFAAQDPLLPDALRHVLGLPDSGQRERSIAYILHRLMASASDVHFFWQEGVGRSNIFDGKKSRSRFIDTAIWKEEQKLGKILEGGETPLNIAPCVLSPIAHDAQHIVITDVMREKLLHMLSRGISPTRLDSYIRCPQRFAWESIYKLAPLEEVTEDYDPLVVGKLLHEVLHELYKPFVGRRVRKDEIDEKLIDTYFHAGCNKEKLAESLPPDSLIMLRMAAPLRLKRFLQNQPELTHIVALEKELCAPIEMENGQKFQLKGVLDRVDMREDHLVILDYKTGKLSKLKLDVWDDDKFWHELEHWTVAENDGQELLMRVAESFASVQLPCYMHLCGHEFDKPVHDAAWVNLAENGEEFYLLGEEPNDAWRKSIIEEQIPILLRFVLTHMATATHFSPTAGEHCKYCPYGALCHR